ncbi:MAG: FG-GAP repeat domain-containing protein [Akkermansiaceae bacterium]
MKFRRYGLIVSGLIALPLSLAGEDQTPLLSDIPGLKKNKFDAAIKDVAQLDDPLADGWQTEDFDERSGAQLKKLGEWLNRDGEIVLAHLIHTDHPSKSLSLGHLSAEVYQNDTLSVRRPSPEAKDENRILKISAEELRELLGSYAPIRSKFKTIRVIPENDGVKTVVYVQLGGRNDSEALQVNATWTCHWDLDKTPRLKTVSCTDYEEVRHQVNEGQTIYSDCTESVFADKTLFPQQLVHGIDHWTARFDGSIARPAAGHGLAISDVNGDGLEDIYVCEPPGLPNLLLIQQPDGTVVDTALNAGVNWHEGTRAAVLNDLDNDGDPDLVAVMGHKIIVQENDGTGKFIFRTIIDAASSLFTINAVDYDGDADLDLFICGYTLSSAINLDDVFANPMPFEDANNGAPNLMLRNDGGWGFTDVTKETGLNENNMRFSYASAWDDIDRDGDLDLYVANDFGRNNLYRNDGGLFKDIAAELGVEDIGPGMSASFGDFDNDGFPDLYVSNMFSSAGNRITTQRQFKSHLDEDGKRDFRRHARGNSLYRNRGNGTFEDVSVGLGVTLGRWAWGSVFADMNNDGWEDLYVANGFITSEGKDRDL